MSTKVIFQPLQCLLLQTDIAGDEARWEARPALSLVIARCGRSDLTTANMVAMQIWFRRSSARKVNRRTAPRFS